MKKAYIKALSYYLPEAILDNHQLALEFPELSAEKIFQKTGIKERHIAAGNEFVTLMAIKAAQKLFAQHVIALEHIDFLLFGTQTPDQLLPNCACVIQDALGLSRTVGAVDFNLGCSAYVYGLSFAKGLIESHQAKNVLFLTADTYSKLIAPHDKSVKTIFGDAASATLVSGIDTDDADMISTCAYGTNGQGAENLCVAAFGLRGQYQKDLDPFLRMQGPNMFEFAIEVVPPLVRQALEKTQLQFDEIDFFVFHQANGYMLEHLRKKLNIPKDKFIVKMDFCGNTVSSSIPIALKEAKDAAVFKGKKNIMLVAFGIGYSWAATVIRFNDSGESNAINSTPQIF